MAAELKHFKTAHVRDGILLAGFDYAGKSVNVLNAESVSEWQELVFIRPPLLPERLWSPGLQVLNTKVMYTIQDGEIQVPDLPGLGLDVNEDAIEKFRQP